MSKYLLTSIFIWFCICIFHQKNYCCVIVCIVIRLLILVFLWSPVQASIAANTWVVSGSPQTKSKIYFSFLVLFKFSSSKFVVQLLLKKIKWHLHFFYNRASGYTPIHHQPIGYVQNTFLILFKIFYINQEFITNNLFSLFDDF